MENALTAVLKERISLNKAAEKHNVPRSTLQLYYEKYRSTPHRAVFDQNFDRLLTPDEESDLLYALYVFFVFFDLYSLAPQKILSVNILFCSH